MKRIGFAEFKAKVGEGFKGKNNPAKQALQKQLVLISPSGSSWVEIITTAKVNAEVDWDGGGDREQNFINNLAKGNGDSRLAIALYYWLHTDKDPLSFAAQVDRIIFNGQTFSERFGRQVLPPKEPDALVTTNKLLRQVIDSNQARNQSWQPSLFLEQVEPSNETWLSPLNLSSIPFVGRSTEQEELNNFVLCNDVFKMWALIGPSGAGKTRLATHWMSTSDVLQGWHIGYLKDRDATSWDCWIPDRPTLIVIDYIHDFAEVIAKIVNLGSSWVKQPNQKFCVRLLVIDHIFPENLDDLMRENIWSLSFPTVADLDTKRPLFYDSAPLAFISQDDQTDIITRVITQTSGIKNANDVRISETTNKLRNMPEAWHPLFAALIGRALSDKQSTEGWSRRDLIKYYLGSSNRLPWLGREDDMGLWAACFVAAATAVRGASIEELSSCLPQTITEHPLSVSLVAGQCRRIVSTHQLIDLPPFEPDILGETFFLMFLEKFGAVPMVKNSLVKMISVQADHGNAHEYLADFVGFIARLFRNLSNENQSDQYVSVFWSTALTFFNPANFQADSISKASISISLLHVVSELLEDANVRRTDIFDDQISIAIANIDAEDLLRNTQESVVLSSSEALLEFISEWPNDIDIPQQIQIAFPRMMKKFESILNDSATALIFASQTGNRRAAEILIQELGEIEAKTAADGFNALMIASMNGAIKIVDLLINSGVDINSCSKSPHYTALMLACMNGQRDVVDRLLLAEADTSVETEDGFTALNLACEFGHPDVVPPLISAGAKIDHQTSRDGATPLLMACSKGHIAIVRYLLESGAATDLAITIDGSTPLMFACQEGHIEIAKLLIEKHCDIHASRKDGVGTALHFACRFGNFEIVKLLISKGADIENTRTLDGATPLILAANNGQNAIVELLIRSGANIEQTDTQEGYSALMVACGTGNEEMASSLIRAGANINAVNPKTSKFPLYYAAVHGPVGLVKLLIDNGADIDAVVDSNISALSIASYSGRSDIVGYLVAAGADVETRGMSDHATPLWEASSMGHSDVVDILIASGADLEAVQIPNGFSPLMIASINNHKSVVLSLIRAGADLEKRDDIKGSTALMWASQNGNREIVESLLAAGSDIEAKQTTEGVSSPQFLYQ